jgi:hypothetical protein
VTPGGAPARGPGGDSVGEGAGRRIRDGQQESIAAKRNFMLLRCRCPTAVGKAQALNQNLHHLERKGWRFLNHRKKTL